MDNKYLNLMTLGIIGSEAIIGSGVTVGGLVSLAVLTGLGVPFLIALVIIVLVDLGVISVANISIFKLSAKVFNALDKAGIKDKLENITNNKNISKKEKKEKVTKLIKANIDKLKKSL